LPQEQPTSGDGETAAKDSLAADGRGGRKVVGSALTLTDRVTLTLQVGTLRGFDVFVNMVLEDVIEYEDTPEGRVETKLEQILLNGNNIALLVPGGGPSA
jgi:small nuclear ribonucleoprotein (snRNP)-like protein